MLHIYYGMGKGKSSTLNGSAIRAVGAGFKVAFVKFLKGRPSSEDNILQEKVAYFKRAQSSEKFVIFMNDVEKKQTKQETIETMEKIKRIASQYDVIIFDELIDLADQTVDFFTPKELADFLSSFSDQEVLISGHSLPSALEQKADLITYYQAEKHYYNKGIKARKGIEF